MAKRPRTPYDELPISPAVVARSCCLYRVLTHVKFERMRQHLSRRRVDAFVEQFDMMCRRAYAGNAAWFRNCLQAREAAGRDALYEVAADHLLKYLQKPYEDDEE